MKTFLQPGEILSLTMPRPVTSGSGMKIGNIFGIATGTFAQNAVGQLKTTGVFTEAKAAGTTFAPGDAVYWDDTAHLMTSVSGGNTKVGVATLTALAGDAGVAVRLNGVF